MPNPPTVPPREAEPPAPLSLTRRQPISSRALAEGDDELGRAVLSSLPAHIAVLDRDGRIIAVNEAWTSFAAANGASDSGAVGSNYIDVCRGAVGSIEAAKALIGLEEVLAGGRPLFTLEYPCHSP